ncbi:MAG: carbohydrate kinase family protein [Clostridiaceae bacterium]
MSKILVMGGTSYDTIIKLKKNPILKGTFFAEDSYERCGSTGTTKAVALKKLGADVTLYSRLGRDFAGDQIKAYLTHNKVPFVTDEIESGTERHINLLDESGDRISIFLPQAPVSIGLDELRLKALIVESDIIVLNIMDYNLPFIPLLKEKEVWTDLHDYLDMDPYYNPFIEASQFVFLSSDRLMDYRSTLKKLGRGGKMVVVTHGKEGSTAYWENRFYEQSAHDFTLVDSDGAGDNYFSGFLVEYLKKRNLERSLMTASVCGGLAIETKELVPESLNYDMLERIMIQKGIR